MKKFFSGVFGVLLGMVLSCGLVVTVCVGIVRILASILTLLFASLVIYWFFTAYNLKDAMECKVRVLPIPYFNSSVVLPDNNCLEEFKQGE